MNCRSTNTCAPGTSLSTCSVTRSGGGAGASAGGGGAAAGAAAAPPRARAGPSPSRRGGRAGPRAGPRAKDVPGPQDRGGQAGLRNRALARRSHLDIGVHHGRWMRDADVDEMLGASAAGGLNRGEDRWQVDTLKLRGFLRRRMRRADEMDDRVRGGDSSGKGGRVQRIADDRRRARGNPPRRLGTHERPHAMTAREQGIDEAPPDISGCAGNKNVAWNQTYFS